jgi:transcriptional regulator with XRE-family HTH domain
MSTAPASTVGANVRAEMARRGITQATLAQHLGISQAQVSKRLSGAIAFDVNELHGVAGFLGVSIDLLTEGVAA